MEPFLMENGGEQKFLNMSIIIVEGDHTIGDLAIAAPYAMLNLTVGLRSEGTFENNPAFQRRVRSIDIKSRRDD